MATLSASSSAPQDSLCFSMFFWVCSLNLALRAFQKDAQLDVDGECGPQTLTALHKALSVLEEQKPTGRTVLISGGNCYIRTAPNKDGKIIGVAHKGDKIPYGGTVSDGGWPMVEHNGQNAWVSGKYARLID